MVSSIMNNLQSMQGTFANTDILEAQFDLINEGVIVLNAEQAITKLNKSAEFLLNTTSTTSVGKKVTEALGTSNSHLVNTIMQTSTTQPQISKLKTHISCKRGQSQAGQVGEEQVAINFYVTKVADQNDKHHSYILVLQPIIKI